MLWVVGFIVVAGSAAGVQIFRQQSEAAAITSVSIVPSYVPVLHGGALVQGVIDETRIPSVVTWSTSETPWLVIDRYRQQWQQVGWTVDQAIVADDSVSFGVTQKAGRAQILAYTSNNQTFVTVTVFHSL
jgi:hypothetical protein